MKEALKKMVVLLGARRVREMLEEIEAERRAQRAYLMDTGGWS